MASLIRFDRLLAETLQLGQQFREAVPFEHVAIDDFLSPEALTEVLAAIPAPKAADRSNDYIFAKNKFENPRFGDTPGVLADLRRELLSEPFRAFLSAIYGRELFVDPAFVGGGIHQGGTGSFLDMHADFNRHPVQKDWLRELNILLYLNPGYIPEYGGSLDLKHAGNSARGSIEPRLNRMVVMLTKGHTLHGYRPIAFPPGSYRTSIAAYAYSLDTASAGEPARSTMWQPEEAGALRSVAARLSPGLVKLKTAVFGSSTARRAGADPDAIEKTRDDR